MQIVTYQFGEIEYKEEHVINFSSGLLGFEQLKKFLLIKTDDELFYWLNSIEQSDIAFPLICTGIIDESYPDLQGYETFGIVTLNPEPAEITVNLKAPVYINQDEKTGLQKILDDEKYAIDYNLFIEEN